ncbi:DUF4097 family beta strand repeat-containing protein [Streptomyces zaomyceticus]|uniref:DUF4097 family beta strand repeat-containing protein n=1 Tax=Streptomyces zaomyceticus TaxID=68286 RepID=UPI0036BE1989
MPKYDTPAAITTVLDIPAGRIRFVASDRADTTVEVLPANAARGRDVKAAGETTVTCADGTLRITAPDAGNQLLGASGSVEITVQLPAGSHVQARAAAADLRGVGRLGDITYDVTQGAVELDETAAARITALDGDIRIGRLNGPARISTAKGDLRVTEAVRGTVELRTRHGEISIGAAPGVSASLDAGTTYGRIHDNLRNEDGAGAALTIHATTAYGDITARSL